MFKGISVGYSSSTFLKTMVFSWVLLSFPYLSYFMLEPSSNVRHDGTRKTPTSAVGGDVADKSKKQCWRTSITKSGRSWNWKLPSPLQKGIENLLCWSVRIFPKKAGGFFLSRELLETQDGDDLNPQRAGQLVLNWFRKESLSGGLSRNCHPEDAMCNVFENPTHQKIIEFHSFNIIIHKISEVILERSLCRSQNVL